MMQNSMNGHNGAGTAMESADASKLAAMRISVGGKGADGP
jgi:hypothetical protein